MSMRNEKVRFIITNEKKKNHANRVAQNIWRLQRIIPRNRMEAEARAERLKHNFDTMASLQHSER